MCPSVFCRLCLCSSTEVKNFVDENGQYNDIYEITAKYFDPMLLTTVICVDCWQHIHEFYEFQQSVLRSQAKLHDAEKNEPLVKLEMVLIDQDNDADNPNKDINLPTVNFEDSNPFGSDDEIPLAEYSIKKIREFENQRIKEIENNLHHLCNISYQHPKEETIDLDYHGGTSTQDEYVFKCTICDKEYKHARGLRRHTVTHFEKDTYQCPYCPTKFQGKKNIPRHVRKLHPNEHPKFNSEQLQSLKSHSNSSVLNDEIFNEESPELEPISETEIVTKQLDNTTEPYGEYKLDQGLTRRTATRTFSSGQNAYQCPYCPTKFVGKKNIPRHVQRLHPNEIANFNSRQFAKDDMEPFKCSLCDKKFRQAYKLRDHVETHSKLKIYKCPYCPTKFQRKKSIPRHMKRLHPNLKLSTLKNVELQNLADQTIEPDYEEEYKFKCTLCLSEYKYAHGLREHMRVKHIAPCIIQCPHCPKKFPGRKNFPRHLQHSHPKEYAEAYPNSDINKLDELLKNSNALLNDVKSDVKIDISLPKYRVRDAFIAQWKRELECDLCKNTFTNFHLLWQHFKDEHPNDKCHVVCCNSKIQSRNKLVEHIRLHLDPNSFKCKICGKCFDDSRKLKGHMLNHKEGKPFQCHVCEKCFRTKTKLLLHSGTHSTEKNYFCKICDKGFATRLILRKHEYNSHKKCQARHLCYQCGKHFFSINDLEEHLVKHV